MSRIINEATDETNCGVANRTTSRSANKATSKAISGNANTDVRRIQTDMTIIVINLLAYMPKLRK